MHPDALSPHIRIPEAPFLRLVPCSSSPMANRLLGHVQTQGTTPGEPLDPAQKEFVWLFPSCQEKPHAAARPDPHSRAAVQM